MAPTALIRTSLRFVFERNGASGFPRADRSRGQWITWDYQSGQAEIDDRFRHLIGAGLLAPGIGCETAHETFHERADNTCAGDLGVLLTEFALRDALSNDRFEYTGDGASIFQPRAFDLRVDGFENQAVGKTPAAHCPRCKRPNGISNLLGGRTFRDSYA